MFSILAVIAAFLVGYFIIPVLFVGGAAYLAAAVVGIAFGVAGASLDAAIFY